MSLALVVVACAAIAVASCGYTTEEKRVADYLQKYGYLSGDNNTLTLNDATVFKHAVSLFQEYYGLPGDGALNEETLDQMRKPRCGLEDFPRQAFDRISGKWPKTHLTWNFHLADKQTLETVNSAFALWAANSSLSFKRNSSRPDILISFRSGPHTFVDPRHGGNVCPDNFRRGDGTIAHAFYPSGRYDYVSEIHIDHEEPWHIYLSKNLPGAHSLLQTLTHEIGHSLGLPHNSRRDSVMFPYTPNEPIFPIKLSLDDILAIQHMYGVNDDDEVAPRSTVAGPTTVEIATTPTEVAATGEPEYPDLCELRHVDAILVLRYRIFIAHGHHVWSIRINERVYDNPQILENYMTFIPGNFTRIAAVYQRPSGDIVLFSDNLIYLVQYPTFKLVAGWPRRLQDLRFPVGSKINAAVNTNRGQTYVIYNEHFVAELDECTMQAGKFKTVQEVFPGIPGGVTSAFRYTDGTLYFITDRQFYKFNEFTSTVTTAGKFDLQIIGIECPRDGLLRQLRDLLGRFARSSNIFRSNVDDEGI